MGILPNYDGRQFLLCCGNMDILLISLSNIHIQTLYSFEGQFRIQRIKVLSLCP